MPVKGSREWDVRDNKCICEATYMLNHDLSVTDYELSFSDGYRDSSPLIISWGYSYRYSKETGIKYCKR